MSRQSNLKEKINHAYQIGDIESARKLEIRYFSREIKPTTPNLAVSRTNRDSLSHDETRRTGDKNLGTLIQYKTYLASIPSVWEWEGLL